MMFLFESTLYSMYIAQNVSLWLLAFARIQETPIHSLATDLNTFSTMSLPLFNAIRTVKKDRDVSYRLLLREISESTVKLC